MTCDTRHFDQMGAPERLRVHQLQLQMLLGHSHICAAGMSCAAPAKQAERTASQPPLNVQAKPTNIHQMIGSGQSPHDSKRFAHSARCIEMLRKILTTCSFLQHSIYAPQSEDSRVRERGKRKGLSYRRRCSTLAAHDAMNKLLGSSPCESSSNENAAPKRLRNSCLHAAVRTRSRVLKIPQDGLISPAPGDRTSSPTRSL